MKRAWIALLLIFIAQPLAESGPQADTEDARLEQLFKQVEFVGRSASNPWALESEVTVHICRGAKFGTMKQLWPELKRWR